MSHGLNSISRHHAYMAEVENSKRGRRMPRLTLVFHFRINNARHLIIGVRHAMVCLSRHRRLPKYLSALVSQAKIAYLVAMLGLAIEYDDIFYLAS